MNTAAIALIVLGVVYFIAEALIPSFGFLGITGLIALLWGIGLLTDSEYLWDVARNPQLTWGAVLVGVIIIAIAVVAAIKVYSRKTSTGAESLIGARATVVEWNGTKGRVRVQGEVWQAESASVMDLQPEDSVTIDSIDNLILKITA